MEEKSFRNKNPLVVKCLRVRWINKDDVNCGNMIIAKLIEHCRANAEALCSNPVEVPQFFYRVNLQSCTLSSFKKIRWMFDQISYPFFTLLFVKLAEENEFGIVKVVYL